MKAMQLRLIKDRLAAATPGPWLQEWPNFITCRTNEFWLVAETKTIGARCRNDSAFIANARQDIESLLNFLQEKDADIKALKAVIKSLRLEIKGMRRLAAVKRLRARKAQRTKETENE